MDLKDKNVIYVGGFGGIGQQCVEEFLKKGVKSLMIFDLKENSEVLQKWRDSYKTCEIYFEPVDATKRETIEGAYERSKVRWDYIDVVVNGCGLMDDRYLDLTIDINLVSLINNIMYMFQIALPITRNNVARLSPLKVRCLYSSSK